MNPTYLIFVQGEYGRGPPKKVIYGVNIHILYEEYTYIYIHVHIHIYILYIISYALQITINSYEQKQNGRKPHQLGLLDFFVTLHGLGFQLLGERQELGCLKYNDGNQKSRLHSPVEVARQCISTMILQGLKKSQVVISEPSTVLLRIFVRYVARVLFPKLCGVFLKVIFFEGVVGCMG